MHISKSLVSHLLYKTGYFPVVAQLEELHLRFTLIYTLFTYLVEHDYYITFYAFNQKSERHDDKCFACLPKPTPAPASAPTPAWVQIFIIQCLNRNSCSSFIYVHTYIFSASFLRFWSGLVEFGNCCQFCFLALAAIHIKIGCNSGCGLQPLTWGKPEKRFCIFINFSALPTEIDPHTHTLTHTDTQSWPHFVGLHNLASVVLESCLEFYFISRLVLHAPGHSRLQFMQ